MSYRVLEQQNIFDIALQEFGSVEPAFDILAANTDMNGITDNILPGNNINMPSNPVINTNIMLIYNKTNQKVTTGMFRQEGVGFWFVDNDFIVS